MQELERIFRRFPSYTLGAVQRRFRPSTFQKNDCYRPLYLVIAVGALESRSAQFFVENWQERGRRDELVPRKALPSVNC